MIVLKRPKLQVSRVESKTEIWTLESQDRLTKTITSRPRPTYLGLETNDLTFSSLPCIKRTFCNDKHTSNVVQLTPGLETENRISVNWVLSAFETKDVYLEILVVKYTIGILFLQQGYDISQLVGSTIDIE